MLQELYKELVLLPTLEEVKMFVTKHPELLEPDALAVLRSLTKHSDMRMGILELLAYLNLLREVKVLT